MKFRYLTIPGQTDVDYRPVVGFEGYAVGSDGSVWSQHRIGRPYGLTSTWHQLHPGFVQGYPIVNLPLGPKRFATRRVPRLVLTAFVGPCPPGMECCHADGNPANNNLSNLRWDTRKGNCADKHRHGTAAQYDKRKLTDADAMQIRAWRMNGWSWLQLSQRFGVGKNSIRQIVAGRTYEPGLMRGRRS